VCKTSSEEVTRSHGPRTAYAEWCRSTRFTGWVAIQTCQFINATARNPSGATGPFYPGSAQSAPGSVFAEPGGVFPNGGKGGQQYNLVGAPSQYDVACYQMLNKP